MTSEVAEPVPRIGELRAADVRRCVVGHLRGGDRIDVVVLAAPRATPFVGQVELVERRAGRGHHVVLRCPACGLGKERLVVRRGRLECRSCSGHLTRRQAERSMRTFRREGGLEEDALVRLLQRPGPCTPGRLERARELKDDLDAIDRARFCQLLLDIDGLVELADEGVSG
jgi:hypothetical protein